MSDQQRLEELLLGQHPCISIATFEERDALELVCHVGVETGRSVLVWSASIGLREGLLENGPVLTDTENAGAALYYLCGRNERLIVVMLDLSGHLKDERIRRLLRDLIEKFHGNGSTLVLIDDQNTELPRSIQAVATPFELSPPDEQSLAGIVRETLREHNRAVPIQVNLNPQEMELVLRNLRGLSRRQARQILTDCICCDRRLDSQDINRILASKRRQFQSIGVLEYVESPVTLDDVGGLAQLKRWLTQRSKALTAEAAEFGISAPRGVLMLGVQGAGKSLAAKAVATAWQRPLLRLDPGSLYDRYIGQSEALLRDALRQAEVMAPIVLWIDEIEKGFSSAASHSVDGGLSQRMFATLLTWMQEHKAPVFMVATANDIAALPPELLRKGRFDEIFFVDLPDLEGRASIFSIHLRKRKREPRHFDLANLALAADGYSGAEIEQAIIAGLHDAFAAKQDLTTELLLQALRKSPPLSVTMAERVASLRQWAKNRCVMAN